MYRINKYVLSWQWVIIALIGFMAWSAAGDNVLAKQETVLKFKRPAIRLPLMAQAPKIDGVIHTNEWAGADEMAGFTKFRASGKLTPQKAQFWVGADRKNLYVAVRSETPAGNKLMARANAIKGGASVGSVFADDAIELRVCPNPNAVRGKQRVYLGMMNAKGAIASRLNATPPRKWQGKWTVKNSVVNNHWDCEIAIPWSSLGVTSPVGKTMAIRVGRDWRQTMHGLVQSEWGLGKTNFAAVSSMPRVTWTPDAPVVQVRQLQSAPNGPADIQVQLFNPTRSKIAVKAHIEVKPSFSNFTKIDKTILLAPGQYQLISVKPAALEKETLVTHIKVTSEASNAIGGAGEAIGGTGVSPANSAMKAGSTPSRNRIDYLRDFSWQRSRPDKIWDLHPNATKRVNIQFAYFPSYHAMHVKVDLSNLANKSKVKGIELLVRKKGSTQSIAHIMMPPLKDGITQIRRWNLPVLNGGTYELVADIQGLSVKPIVKSFVRDHFPWENNKLGTSDILVPPFTPIKIKGHTLSVILRDYQLNSAGLWNQVTSAGKKLLTGPMQLNATIGGEKITASGTMQVVKHSKTGATIKAQWHAGALHGTTKNIWYYDGVMKSIITLLPPEKTVDHLTIRIPLNKKIAHLMDVVTLHTSKQPFAGAVPKGTGVVWKSSQMPSSVIGNYVGYLWVGGPVRGVAVFGSNDAGWITSTSGECQQIIRKPDGSIVLLLNLIQKPSKWKNPRKIVIGFQATPAKPMPKHWRLWSVNNARDSRHASKLNVPGMYKQAQVGSRTYLGGITSFSNVFPGDGTPKDYTLWKAFERARQTGKYDPAFGRQWVKMAMAKYRRLLPKKAASRQRTILRSVLGMLRPMSTQPDGVVIYTDPRAMSPYTLQGQTYLNEWSRAEFPQRQWQYGSSIDYGVNPVRSYRDCRVWYYHKSLSTFADGIYWDNVFITGNHNPITSPAYVLPDGRVQPADGLWHMRKLIKRGAVLEQEMGKPNRNMVHMSGTPIVPVIDFSATQYDWELKYGAGDFQAKFPRDFIQVESTGRQAGLVPIVLMVNNKFIVGTKKEKAWQYRTAAGVMLTHEIKPSSSRGQYGSPDSFWANYDRLVAFGYGQGAKVYNYWQPDYPAKIGGQTSSLLISKPGAAMLVLCDYSGDGKAQHTYHVALNESVLGLSENLKAVNVETNKPIPMNRNILSITLKKHDFMVIRIDAKNK